MQRSTLGESEREGERGGETTPGRIEGCCVAGPGLYTGRWPPWGETTGSVMVVLRSSHSIART